jgi:hypothetical protein
VAADSGEGDENVDANREAQVGQKRTKTGATARRTARPAPPLEEAPAAVDANAIMVLNADAEERLCKAVNDMLVQQRYVDEWKVEGIQRWLQENKTISISREMLEQYFDRVDQSLPATVPHVLYDVAEKTVHRDY